LSGAQPVEVINEYRPAEDSPGGPDDLSVQVATLLPLAWVRVAFRSIDARAAWLAIGTEQRQP
jgi:hypothetical protein